MLDQHTRHSAAISCVCAALSIGLVVLAATPGRESGFGEPPGRPLLNLPVAGGAEKVHRRGIAEVSLTRRGEWVSPLAEQAVIEDLAGFLAREGERIRQGGSSPGLRLRIAADAPAKYVRDAAMAAEAKGYRDLWIACREP